MNVIKETVLKDWCWENRITNPINVTFSEKQVQNQSRIDDIKSTQNFRHFKNVLNFKTFGNGYNRFGKQLKMLVVREVSSNLRHHLHCIIEQPKRFEIQEFEDLIRKCWKSTHFGYYEIHLEKPPTLEREDGWLHYILKGRTKLNLMDSIDWENTFV
jgi:hypothetical protein